MRGIESLWKTIFDDVALAETPVWLLEVVEVLSLASRPGKKGR